MTEATSARSSTPNVGVRALPDVRRRGARSPKLAAYASLVAAGKVAAAAFAETLGPIEPLDRAFRLYYQRDIFPIGRSTSTSAWSASAFPCGGARRPSPRPLRAMFHA